MSLLPKDLRKNVYSFLPLNTLGFLARTAKQHESDLILSQLLKAAINAAPEPLDAKKDVTKVEAKPDATALNSKTDMIAVDAKPDTTVLDAEADATISDAKPDLTALASIAILKKHPELLFQQERVQDHYGRVFIASPYQVFLGAGDVWALEQIKNEILPLIPDGEKTAAEQFQKQFPECPWPLPESKPLSEEMLYDERNIRQIAEIKKQLATVKQLLDADHFDDEATQKAVDVLCQLFKPTPEEVIRSGLHFPLAIIREIYKTYDALHEHWSFFSLKVIKPALDALSTVDGQCCQYGLESLDKMIKGPNRRCHPSYQHPLGRPLNLELVNGETEPRRSRLVDPVDGFVLFDSSFPGYFDVFDKDGGLRGVAFFGDAQVAYFGKLMENKSKSLWVNYATTHREVSTPSNGK